MGNRSSIRIEFHFTSLQFQASTELHDYNHLDFIWGLRAPNDIYTPIIAIINEDLK